MVHSNSLHYDSSIGMGFPDGLVVKNPPPKAEGPGSIPGSGRFLGGGQGNPLHYTCLENPMNRGNWWATVDGVAKESDINSRLNNNTNSITTLL